MLAKVVRLLRHPVAIARIDAAIEWSRARGITSAVRPEVSWEDLLRAIAEDPAGIAIVDPYFTGPFDAQQLRTACGRALKGQGVVYADFGGRPANDVRTMMQVGVERVLTLDVDDSALQLRDAVLASSGHYELAQLVARISQQLTQEQKMILRWSVRRGRQPTSVAGLSKDMDVSSRTLRRWCVDLPGLSPKDLLRWGRVLHVGHVLANTELTVSAVSYILGFSSQGDLRRKFRAAAGVSLSRVPRDQLVEVVLDCYRRQLLKGVEERSEERRSMRVDQAG